VHAEGAAISAQIGHAGPGRQLAHQQGAALAPVRFFNPLSMRFARKATRDDIREVTEQHANAARLAIEAGFDAVEIHLGHNYLASSFLSPMLNRRDDEFGGSLENRAKVARGAVRAVRAGGRRPDRGDGQAQHVRRRARRIPIEESLQTAKWLEEDGGLDALG
jgi:2,4-dienoyl-CoA reductase-like NADH-dependent reductase (Old Yellow Enzyme family)